MARLKPEDASPRFRNSLLAFASTILLSPLLIIGIDLQAGFPLSEITYTFSDALRLLAFIVPGALVPAAMMLRARRLEWYWAALLGPIIGFPAIAALGAAFKYLQ